MRRFCDLLSVTSTTTTSEPANTSLNLCVQPTVSRGNSTFNSTILAQDFKIVGPADVDPSPADVNPSPADVNPSPADVNQIVTSLNKQMSFFGSNTQTNSPGVMRDCQQTTLNTNTEIQSHDGIPTWYYRILRGPIANDVTALQRISVTNAKNIDHVAFFYADNSQNALSTSPLLSTPDGSDTQTITGFPPYYHASAILLKFYPSTSSTSNIHKASVTQSQACLNIVEDEIPCILSIIKIHSKRIQPGSTGSIGPSAVWYWTPPQPTAQGFSSALQSCSCPRHTIKLLTITYLNPDRTVQTYSNGTQLVYITAPGKQDISALPLTPVSLVKMHVHGIIQKNPPTELEVHCIVCFQQLTPANLMMVNERSFILL
ncbi:unnamed protein product [Didymodactylos carnosus]|uniref:Uncharacterized protein n=1 Tax=Didymodactylos carnosus TaxID=1234261 RepID=A0A8S2E437_9BILA|nr:unnamed protein product [Didymodactylos carnosus]CAF3844331.1 unnamed protein product [Didymodactylos carnosus]